MRVACLAIGFLWTAFPGAEVLYRLPWAEGLSFMFTQVSDGRITSHFTKATRHAVDIAMPEGIPIVAARGGIVEAVEARYGASPEEEPLTYEGNFVLVRHAVRRQQATRTSRTGASRSPWARRWKRDSCSAIPVPPETWRSHTCISR